MPRFKLPFYSPRHLGSSLLVALVFFKDGMGSDLSGGRTMKSEYDEYLTAQVRHQNLTQETLLLSDYVFTLKVQVRALHSQQILNQATVEIYVNYTKVRSTLTGKDGSVLLQISYQLGCPLTVVASMNGYIATPLSWKSERLPIFSSVTLLLVALTQGNMWIFDDSVLITGRIADTFSQPRIEFPKRLLNLTESGNMSSVRAYLTGFKLPIGGDHFQGSLDLVSSKSGYASVDLSTLAAVSVQLFSGIHVVQVTGPIKITLPVPFSSGVKASQTVAAWFFNLTTGQWTKKGLGKMEMVKDKLMWSFTAPHLGYWKAALLPSTKGIIALAVGFELMSKHVVLLIAMLGGTLAVLIIFFALLLCQQRWSIVQSYVTANHAKTIGTSKRDQSTATYDNELFEMSSEVGMEQSSLARSGTQYGDSGASQTNLNLLDNLEDIKKTALEIDKSCECIGLAPPTATDDLLSSHITSQQSEVLLSLNKNLLFKENQVHFYNQPVAILQEAPAVFSQLVDQPDPSLRIRSATLPRAGVLCNTCKEPLTDSFNQMLLLGFPGYRHPSLDSEEQPESLKKSAGSSSLALGHYSSLPESVSVLGTLNGLGDSTNPCLGTFSCELQVNSEQALGEGCIGKMLSPLPPRAWFVSLDGKPAAEIHYTVTERQRRRRPVTNSLDSGVDMSELSRSRRPGTLGRSGTFLKTLPNKDTTLT